MIKKGIKFSAVDPRKYESITVYFFGIKVNETLFEGITKRENLELLL